MAFGNAIAGTGATSGVRVGVSTSVETGSSVIFCHLCFFSPTPSASTGRGVKKVSCGSLGSEATTSKFTHKARRIVPRSTSNQPTTAATKEQTRTRSTNPDYLLGVSLGVSLEG